MPITIIALAGFHYFYAYLKTKKIWSRWPFQGTSGLVVFWGKYMVFQIIGVLLISSAVFSITAEVAIVLWDRYPVYLKEGVYNGLVWLKNNVKEDEIILSSALSGNMIPAFTGRTVYIGHGHQTSDWFKKMYSSELFFFGNNLIDQKKEAWLKEQGIDYIFYGSKEKSLGSFDPAAKQYLRPVYSSLDLVIYQVK